MTRARGYQPRVIGPGELTREDAEQAALAHAAARRRVVITYNVSMLGGTATIGVGTYLVAGLGPALIVAGALVLALTIYSRERLNRRSRRALDRTESA